MVGRRLPALWILIMVAGFKMTSMREAHTEEALIEHIDSASLITEPYRFKDICLTTLKPQDLECVEASFELKWTRDATLKSLVLWFDSIFTSDGRLAKGALSGGTPGQADFRGRG
jgi:hypothetical protein